MPSIVCRRAEQVLSPLPSRLALFWLLSVLFLQVGWPSMLFAESSLASDKAEQADSYPGLSELGPRLTQLVDFVEKADDRLAQAAEVAMVRQRFEQAVGQVDELKKKVAVLGDPETWYVDRLTQVNDQFRKLRKELAEIQGELTTRQQEIELIRSRHKEEVTFWQGWGAELKKQKVQVPEKSVRKVRQVLTRLGQAVKEASARVLKLQEQVSTAQQTVIAELDLFEVALDKIRQATFRKNAHSFISPEFYASFSPALLKEALRGLEAFFVIDWKYAQEFSWVFGLMVCCILLVGWVISHYRERFEATDEWQFVLRHPWAAGFFAAQVLFTPLLPAASPLLRFCLVLVGVSAVTILAAPLLENRRQARVLVLAAIVLMLTTAFRLIALPQSLYRVYIAVLALAAIPLLLHQVKTSLRERRADRGRFFRGLLRLGCLVLFISLAGQVSGYINFSFWLLEASFETGVVILFSHMAMRLGKGGIGFFCGRPEFQQNSFFRRYASEMEQKLERLLGFGVLFSATLRLLPVWRLFDSVGDAWETLTGFGITLGELDITLRMVILAAAAFYLSLQVSWLLQGLCETQVFYRKTVDRGVRDAIKKLIHYGIVLVGLLFALSSLGLGLQNFVVLLGAFGVGIGFGLQDIVNHFLSGLILLFERPIKVGDFIVVNEEWGTVTKIGLRSTVVETIDQAEIIVPNSQLIAEKVTNWTLSTRVARLVVPVGVAYGSDVTLVMQILTEVATGHPDAVADPAPSILFMEFGESSLNFEIRVFVRDISSRFGIRSEMLQQIDDRFREAGIEIPFPQRDLHLRSADGKLFESLSGVVRPRADEPNPS